MADNLSSLAVNVTSSTQIFPESKQESPIVTPLSIIDSTVSYFGRCTGIWFYEPPAGPEFALSIQKLEASLSKTLNSYRPWCGRLSYAVAVSNRGHTNRYRRVQVTYNASTDLGVTFVVATSPRMLSDFLPSPSARKSSLKVWDPAKLYTDELVPDTKMALSSGNPPADAPNMIVQVTTFSCGSTSIGIVIAHGLSDAQAMCTFANDWASVSRALHSASPLPTLSPVFDPQLLDSAAAGDIDAENPDEDLVNEARSLPQHRFDWYKEVPGQPWPVRIPDDFDHSATLSPSDPMPWQDWDTKCLESGRVIQFTAAEVQNIYNVANTSGISKHDALLAHVWSLIVRARQLPPNTTSYLNLTFGLRSRLGLPGNFLGSPIMLTAIPFPASSTMPPLSTVASTIRSTLLKFTPSAIGACLHDAAFEVSPQRLWRCFMGEKHIIQTSWIQSGVQNVDFIGEGGPALRYVHPVIGGNGLLLVMEALGTEKGHWTVNGVDVFVSLEAGAMERLCDDPRLWGEGVV